MPYERAVAMADNAKEELPSVFDDLIYADPEFTVLSDNPVSLKDIKKDIFNFGYHLGPIYDIIRDPNTKMPLTIGINGKWGTGKTTAMKWLYDALELWNKSPKSKGKVKTRNVWFYPWKYHQKEDVWKGLIAEVILNATNLENASYKTVLKAVKLLSAFVGKSALDILSASEFEAAGLKVKGVVAEKIKEEFKEANHPEKPYLNEYEHALEGWVKDILSSQNERMIILIDDLDRCMPDIALQVFEALKLYLKIDRLIFVIGMDRTVIEKAVKAYYANKRIRDIDHKQYLDKMLQVELQLSPQKKEMDSYLDDQLQEVNYKKNLEYTDENGNKKFYSLFRDLISRHGGRNPREIKRLINGSLIRGAGAGRIKKEQNENSLTFEQGVQIFFIQRILAKEYNQLELVGDGGAGDEFFAMWSEIVRKHAGEEGFPRAFPQLKEDFKTYEEVDKNYEDTYPTMAQKRVPVIPAYVHEGYHNLMFQVHHYKLPVLLLANEDLGGLMQIEYSMAIAEFAKGQNADLLKTNDETIIRNAIATNLGKEPQDLKEKDYELVPELSLYDKKITDIRLLEQCKNLKKLHLSKNGISDVSALKGLTNLMQLWLDDNQINDISALNGLKNLTHLWLSNNQISDISPLEKLASLNVLALYGNQLSNISPLGSLTNLTALS